ncbi:nucleoside monophosphate kinase [Clostridiaceae bacterium M8S5]|nr:nucleoside monophosphate kinase [Clostridiaceae bacterium M8S5]
MLGRDEWAINILMPYIQVEKNNYILDGFPRTLKQARLLDLENNKLKCKIDLAIKIEVSKETLMDRVSKRIVCKSCGIAYNADDFDENCEKICPECDSLLIKEKR